MKKYLTLLLTLCMVFGLLAGCAEKPAEPSAQTDTTQQDAALTFATSYEQVYKALAAAKENTDARNDMNASAAETLTDGSADGGDQGESADGTFYSGTNVQVQGVDEGDIVKTDGTYIYILRECEWIIMQADGAEVTDVSHTVIGQEWDSGKSDDGSSHGSEKLPQELYLAGDRAVILSTYYDWSERVMEDSSDSAQAGGSNYVSVDLYDISDPVSPKLVKSLGQDGYLVASRMIDGVVYLCTSYYTARMDEDAVESYVPCLYTDGERRPVECDTIGLLPYEDSMTYAVLASYDVAAGSLLNSQSILGGGETVYMNAQNLYLSRSVYRDQAGEPYQEDNYTVTEHKTDVQTTVNRFSVTDGKLVYAATGTVPGALLNQFSMDENAGCLRLVTTENTGSYRVYVDKARGFENYDADETKSVNDLFVLDGDLKIAGSVTGLAENERIYSARFDGDYGYVCTYRTVDPIFAIDLSNPANPSVLGELKLPGYSDYLHVWNDGLLFGLGMNTQEIETEGQTTARVEGMKMIMVDTSDPANLTAQHTMDIDADYSVALNNHKAILVDSEKNLIAFPAEGSYLVYSYTAESGFKLEAEISVSEWDWNNRGLYIGSYFYVVGSDYVNILNMETLENVGQAIISRG